MCAQVCGAQQSTSDFLRQDFFLSLEFMLCLAGWPVSFYNLHVCAQHLRHWDNRVYHNTWLPAPLKIISITGTCAKACVGSCVSQFSITWVLGIKLRLSGWQQAPLPSKLSSWLFVVCDINSGSCLTGGHFSHRIFAPTLEAALLESGTYL